MSEKDAIVTIPSTGKGVIAEAVKIHAPVEGDRIAYHRTMEAFEIAIEGGAPMDPDNIIGAAEQRGDPMATVETDASILKSAVGIKDYPDGSFMGVFKDGQRMMISGQLESPTTQIVPISNNLVSTGQTQIETVDVVKGIMVSSNELNPQLSSGMFYRPLTQQELDLANRKN